MKKVRTGFVLALAILLAPRGLYPFRSTGEARSQNVRLNLLLVTIDTLRADRVSFYSSKHLRTPHLDSLASRSLVFTRAFAHTTTTLPSHTNILLGVTPAYHGVHDNANFIVRDELLTLAEHLRASGYSTGAFVGGFPLDSRFGLDQGFDVYDDNFGGENQRLGQGAGRGERKAQAVLDNAWRWLEGRESPWFLWIHFYDPHDPYTPPEPFRTSYAADPYDGEVAYVDAVVGSLTRALEGRGLFEKTMIVLTGDHGESLGEHDEQTHGFLAYNTTLWIPLVIRYPGAKPGTIGQNVSHIDIFPTVCDGLGLQKPKHLQGISLFPLFDGKKIAAPAIYFESLSPYYSMGWAPIRGYIKDRDKFIASPRPELYDLQQDFEEKNDLAPPRELGGYQRELDRLIKLQTSAESGTAEQPADRETRERLRSLGYVASLPAKRKTVFAPEDSVRALLPYENRSGAALALYQAGKASAAVEALKEVITARKNISSAYLNLAFIYKSQGKLADAISVLNMGCESMPENYPVYFQLIADLYEAGLFDDVLKTFAAQRFAEVEFDPVVWNYVGLAYEKKGDVQNALASYEQALAIDDTFGLTYSNLGALYFGAFRKTHDPGRLGQAVESYEKAVEVDPTYGQAHYGLGVAYFQAGNSLGAIASLEKALTLDGRLDEAYYFLGSAYLKSGDKSKAYSSFMKYKSTRSYELLSPSAKAKLEETIAQTKERSPASLT